MSKTSRQSDNPYVGPRTFERDEGHLYFGREREAGDLLSLVISERLVLFYGPSAGGKSSLINTRLIPALKKRGFEVLPKGRVGAMAPPKTPVDNIFVHNLLLSLNREEGETRPLRDPNKTISEFLWEYGADLAGAGEGEKAAVAESKDVGAEGDGAAVDGDLPDMAPGALDPDTGEVEAQAAEEALLEIWPRALIIDQFEEILITNLHEWEKREDFFRQLASALADDEYLWVILAIRDDYVAGLEPYSHLLPGKLKARFYLQRMGFDAALQAVTGPVAGRRPFDEGVAEELVDHLRQLQPYEQEGLPGAAVGQYVKPVQLQVVCYYLWEDLRKHPGERITYDDLRRLAGGEDLACFVEQALGNFYEQAIEEAVEDRPGCTEFDLRDWFEHTLITQDRTRAPVLCEAQTTGGLDNDVVQELEERFLLRSESRAGNLWYELRHDRLIPLILQSNAAWRREHPLIEDAQRWENTGGPDELLYRGTQLKEALEHPEAGIPVVRAFLVKAQDAEKRRAQARKYKRMGVIAGLLTLAIVVLVGVTIWAARNEKRAERAMETAEVERVRAEDSHKTAVVSYGTATAALGTAEAALDTAEEALGIARTESTAVVQQRDRAMEAEAAVEAALTELEAENRRYNALDLAEAAKRSLDVDQDLSLLLAVQALRPHLDAGEPPPIEAEDALQQAVLSARGEAAVLLARAERVRELLLPVDEFGAYDVDWSPDGINLATVGEEGRPILWDAATGEQLLVMPGEPERTFRVDFSPDGRWLATGSWEGSARVWDLQAEDPAAGPLVLSGHEGEVFSVDFGPDGRWLATASLDGTARVWDLQVEDPAAEPLVLSGHEAGVFSVDFGPDGSWLATGSFDFTARVWDLQTGDPSAGPLVLTGHEGDVYSVDFSPDGRWLATGSSDGTAQVWDLQARDPAAEPLVLSGHEGEVYSVDFSPDGRWLAAGSSEGTAQVWDLQARDPAAEPLVLSGHEAGVVSVAFGPDATRLATASLDGTARVWDLEERRTGRRAPQRTYLDFNDGSRLAVAREDGVVTVWDVSANEQVQVITATDQISVTGVAFDEDGVRLMATGGEEWLRAWAADSGRVASLPPLQAGDMLTNVVATAFSADGSRLAAVSEVGTVGLWDLENGQLLWSLQLRELPSISKQAAATGETQQAPVATPEPGVPNGEPAKAGEAAMIVGQLALDEDGSILAVAVEFQPADEAESHLAPMSQTMIQAWDADAAEELPGLTLAERVKGLALSPGGDLAAAAIEFGDVLVWDPRIREEPLRLTSGDPVDALVFSSDGKHLATATRVETRIWDVSNREGKSVTLPSAGGVWDLAFSPDGSHLAVAALRGGVDLYPLDVEVLLEEACSMVTRNLTQVEWETNERAVEFPQICPQQPLHDTVILALVREGKVLKARNYVVRAVGRAQAAGYELDIVPDDVVASAYFAWAEQLAAEGDYDEALKKLDLGRREAPGLGLEGRAEAAVVAFAICRKGTEFDPSAQLWPACGRVAELAWGISLGEMVTGTVDSEAGDVWAFDGEEGQLLTIAMDRADPDLDPYLNLYALDGRLLTSDDDSGTGFNARIVGFRLPEDGTYLVNADGRGDDQGAYILIVQKTKVAPVRLGQTVTGTAEQDTLWMFEGQEDQNVWIEVRWLGDWADTRLTLAVDDRTLETRYGSGPSVLVLSVLPASGTYTLLVQTLEGGAGAYTLSLDEFQARGTLRAGDTVTAEIAGVAGDVWTFDGDEGVWIDMRSRDFTPSLGLHTRSGHLAGHSVAASPEERATVGLSGVAEPSQGPGPVLIVARSADDGVTGSYTLSLSLTSMLDLPQACGVDLDTPDIDPLNVDDSVILAPPRLVEGAWIGDFGVDEADLELYAGRPGIVVGLLGVDEQGCPIVLVESEGTALPWRVRDLRLVVVPVR